MSVNFCLWSKLLILCYMSKLYDHSSGLKTINFYDRLCHIVHGPHNRDFHALWNQLRDEHEELVIKGYTGEGFLSQGKRLGGRQIPLDEARRLARVAAEKRRTISAGSGQKLGGAPLLKGSDVRKVIADAAQRRIDVTNGCASGSSDSEKLADEASRNGFRTKAEEDDANERAIMQAYIEMIQEDEKEKYGASYVPPSQSNPAGPRGKNVYPTELRPPPVPTHTKPIRRFASSGTLSSAYGTLDQNTENTIENDMSWNCQICTLENPPAYLCCDACGTERPAQSITAQSRLVVAAENTSSKRATPKPRSRLASQVITGDDAGRVVSFKGDTSERITNLDQNRAKKPLGWLCHMCGAFMETEWWTCSACGTMKTAS